MPMETDYSRLLVSSGLSPLQASRKARLFTSATRALQESRALSNGVHYWFVPGRIEIIGKHTD